MTVTTLTSYGVTMLHEWIQVWFGWVEHWGYAGIFLLMALESSIVPVPSEIVMAPAAFWAVQGKFTLTGVILCGTVGSLAGSAINYFAFRWLGIHVLRRYGKFVLLPPKKLEFAEHWVQSYGTAGVFFSRLLPVVRHLVSMPAGAFKMPIVPFFTATTLGAGLWCTVLSFFGAQVLGDSPDLLQSPEAMARAVKAKLIWFVLGVIGFAVLYGLVVYLQKQKVKLSPQKSS